METVVVSGVVGEGALRVGKMFCVDWSCKQLSNFVFEQ